MFALGLLAYSAAEGEEECKESAVGLGVQSSEELSASRARTRRGSTVCLCCPDSGPLPSARCKKPGMAAAGVEGRKLDVHETMTLSAARAVASAVASAL